MAAIYELGWKELVNYLTDDSGQIRRNTKDSNSNTAIENLHISRLRSIVKEFKNNYGDLAYESILGVALEETNKKSIRNFNREDYVTLVENLVNYDVQLNEKAMKADRKFKNEAHQRIYNEKGAGHIYDAEEYELLMRTARKYARNIDYQNKFDYEEAISVAYDLLNNNKLSTDEKIDMLESKINEMINEYDMRAAQENMNEHKNPSSYNILNEEELPGWEDL